MKPETKKKISHSLTRIANSLIAKEDLERSPREDLSKSFSVKKLRKKCPESVKDLTEDVGSKDPDFKD